MVELTDRKWLKPLAELRLMHRGAAVITDEEGGMGHELRHRLCKKGKNGAGDSCQEHKWGLMLFGPWSPPQ